MLLFGIVLKDMMREFHGDSCSGLRPPVSLPGELEYKPNEGACVAGETTPRASGELPVQARPRKGPDEYAEVVSV